MTKSILKPVKSFVFCLTFKVWSLSTIFALFERGQKNISVAEDWWLLHARHALAKKANSAPSERTFRKLPKLRINSYSYSYPYSYSEIEKFWNQCLD